MPDRESPVTDPVVYCENGDCENEAVELVCVHDNDEFAMCAVCARAYRLGYDTAEGRCAEYVAAVGGGLVETAGRIKEVLDTRGNS